MKPNIFLLVIDSLRTDKFLGKSKSSQTPNLESLISKGTYFEQMISSSDQTGTSIASIFTGLFPYRKNLNEFTFTENQKTFLTELNNAGYHTDCYLPDIDFFIKLSKQMNNFNLYDFMEKESWKKINEGLGDDIIKKIPNSSTPWFYYVHVMDVRYPFILNKNSKEKLTGNTNYDKIVSSLDTFFGELLKKIDFSNTLFVITSDHGEYIPVTDKFNKKSSKIEKIISNKTKSKPFLENIGRKAIMNIRFASQTYQKEKLKRELTPIQLRSLNSRAQIDLYDELVRIPFLLIGPNIPMKKKINQLVRQVDIFPTLLKISETENKESIDGISLLEMIKKDVEKELVAYLEVGINAGQLINNKSFLPEVIGLRTKKFKYFRNRSDPDKHVNLFNLVKDPHEEENIAENNSDIVKKLEEQLQTLLNNTDNVHSDSTKNDRKEAIDLLEKLGYI